MGLAGEDTVVVRVPAGFTSLYILEYGNRNETLSIPMEVKRATGYDPTRADGPEGHRKQELYKAECEKRYAALSEVL